MHQKGVRGDFTQAHLSWRSQRTSQQHYCRHHWRPQMRMRTTTTQSCRCCGFCRHHAGPGPHRGGRCCLRIAWHGKVRARAQTGAPQRSLLQPAAARVKPSQSIQQPCCCLGAGLLHKAVPYASPSVQHAARICMGIEHTVMHEQYSTSRGNGSLLEALEAAAAAATASAAAAEDNDDELPASRQMQQCPLAMPMYRRPYNSIVASPGQRCPLPAVPYSSVHICQPA